MKDIIVITGATSGIGAETARLLAREENKKIVLVGRNHNKGKSLQQEIIDAGGDASFFQCDVTNRQDISRLCEMIGCEYGRVSVLFNNAGKMPESKEIEKISEEEWNTTFETNLHSIYRITSGLKQYLYTGKGCIINNASIAGMHSYIAGRSYAYSASKAAVIQFTRQMAKNYAPDGIRVNCICPGIIDTPILEGRDRQAYRNRIPLGHLGKPEDVARLVRFLASKDSSYITGAVIPIDGGVSL